LFKAKCAILQLYHVENMIESFASKAANEQRVSNGVVKLQSSLRTFYGHHHDLVNHYRVSVSQNTTWYVPFVVVTIRGFPFSWLITMFVRRVRRFVSHVKQKILILPEYPRSPSVISGVRVSRWWVMFCRSLFVPSSIFGPLMFALCYANICRIRWFFILLAHWNNSTLGHIIIIAIEPIFAVTP